MAAQRELDDISEQHQAVDPIKRGEQALEGGRPAQHIVTRTLTEVQVGDEQRPHGRAR